MALGLPQNNNGTYVPYDFDEAIRRRAPKIDQLGIDATNYQIAAAQRLAQKKAMEQQQQFNALNQTAIWNASKKLGPADDMIYRGEKGVVGPYSGGGGSFGKFMAAISGQESGGNYRARNPTSGAMGKYQIMPGNLGGSRSGWDYEALGRDISVNQFMSSPQLQEQIAQYKLRQYYNKYGPAGAAIAWYAGPGAAQKFIASGRTSRNPEGNYPSVDSYMNSILRRMGL